MGSEQRRSKRKPPEHVIHVVNAMTGQSIGRIGNLSIDGLMLMATVPLREDALYQFVFSLPGNAGHPVPVEVGVHEQWLEPAGAPGQYWAGFRIIDISAPDYETLRHWVDASG
jgi:hypothetical protein